MGPVDRKRRAQRYRQEPQLPRHFRAVLAQPGGGRRQQHLPGAGHAQLRQGRTKPGGAGWPRLAGLRVPPDRRIRRRRLMKHAFETLVGDLSAALQAGEQFTLGYSAEQSQFVRFNHAKVRQAGEVSQASAQLRLIRDGRQAEQQVTLSGDAQLDRRRLADALEQLRQTLPLLAVDPYLRLDESAWHSHRQQEQPLPELSDVLTLLEREAGDLDLVGIYAAGPICRGFASSFGAFGWHQANSFNFDWSLFHENGEAVKANYAGQVWSADDFTARRRQAREQLCFLGRPAVTLKPGSYRAYLAPAAVDEIAGMLCWGGFSAQALATGNSALQRLYNGDARLSPLVSFT
ncbi:protein of unknown function, partial [Pseudomonas inefficax]